jgi:hypothetical protein
VAVPDEGYRFGEWTGDVGTIADVNATITMNGDDSIMANFVKQQCNCRYPVTRLDLASRALNRAGKV